MANYSMLNAINRIEEINQEILNALQELLNSGSEPLC